MDSDIKYYIELCFYIFSSINVLMVLLGLGKFFYVKVLNDLFDTLDETFDYTLTKVIVGFGLLNVLIAFGLAFDWRIVQFIGMIIMTFANVLLIIFLSIPLFTVISDKLDEIHHNIKCKKTQR